MRPRTSIQLALAALAAAAVAAAPALGAGEPKNEAPFTARFNADPGYAKAIREAAGVLPLPRLRHHRFTR